jgi:hypothetical protein
MAAAQRRGSRQDVDHHRFDVDARPIGRLAALSLSVGIATILQRSRASQTAKKDPFENLCIQTVGHGATSGRECSRWAEVAGRGGYEMALRWGPAKSMT